MSASEFICRGDISEYVAREKDFKKTKGILG